MSASFVQNRENKKGENTLFSPAMFTYPQVSLLLAKIVYLINICEIIVDKALKN